MPEKNTSHTANSTAYKYLGFKIELDLTFNVTKHASAEKKKKKKKVSYLSLVSCRK